MSEYREVNRASWDERASSDAASPEFAFARFAEDPSFLSYVVRYDLPRLGEIRDLEGVHLQCHIGTDTVSLARLGARMTGLDFSSASLDQARRLATVANVEATFVLSDVYGAAAVLGRGCFDLVYTGVGALCWLPDINRWAQVVADLLRPGGRLFLREGHPVLWTLSASRPDGLLVLERPYFEREQPNAVTHEWNHGLGEIVTAVLNAGMELTMLEEHDSAPWEALPGQMEDVGGGEWRLSDRPGRLPHTYTLQGRRPPHQDS